MFVNKNIIGFASGLVVLLLVLSLVVNVVLGLKMSKSDGSSAIEKENALDYPFLSPRIFANIKNELLINFIPLRNELRDDVKPYGDTFAFYFEYLPSGISIGVNQSLEFTSASLIKVPVAIAYFHQMERTGLNIGDQIVTVEPQHVDNRFGDLWKRGSGLQVSLKEAMETMLIDSDNTAANVLADHIMETDFEDVYEGLDIDLNKKGREVLVTAKNYSSVLKSLYFSSLVSKKSSQDILQLLSKTKFDDKLRAGVPKGITVAHKIGVYNDNLYQDCGIVYEPKRPYILCMISQTDEQTARVRMQDISKKVYEFVHAAVTPK